MCIRDRDNVYYFDPLMPKIRFKLSEKQPQKQKNGFNIYKIDGLYLLGKEQIRFELQIKAQMCIRDRLFTEGREPTDQALVEAATIAATLSKGKNAGKVDIDYTKRANVWKANGAKPGMVLYEGHKTLTVAPDAALVKQLEKEMED